MEKYKGKRTRKKYDSGSQRSRKSGRPKMHVVNCDKCGKKCEVPFKPTKGKPVYCSECFKSKSGNQGLEQINKKLDKIMKALDID